MRPTLFALAACLAIGPALAQSPGGLDRPATIPPTGNPVGKIPATPKVDNAVPAPLTDPAASKAGGGHVEGTTSGASRGGTDKIPDGSSQQLNSPKAR